MADRFDVIVIGLGAMGTAACFHMAKRGQRVLGLEQFSMASELCSSHGGTRLYRLAYYEHADYVPLLHRAGELWAALERDSGRTLMHRKGAIFMGCPECELIAGTLVAADEYDVPCERLDRAELGRRFPQFAVPDDHVGVFEPKAAILLPEAIIRTHAELATRHGAVLHEYEKVVGWGATHAGVTVRTDRGTYEAGRLVLCAGPWSGALLAGLGIELTVTRQPVAWVRPKAPQRCGMETFPVWAIEDPRGSSFFYGFPLTDEGLKVSRHFIGSAMDIETADRRPGPDDEPHFRDLTDALHRFIPDADGPVVSRSICVYTCTRDGHFVIDHHPAHENVVVACGFSGHGFKFATVVGEALADLAIHGRSELPIGFLGTGRFREFAG